MITYRKLSADGAGKLIVAYLREHQLAPETDVRTEPDAARDVETGDRLNNYYTGKDGRGAWGPNIPARIAAALGIDVTRPPTDEELARLFECRRASDGEEWDGKHANRTISAIDFTASPDKSVTLAAEFAATKAEQALIWHIIQRANDQAMHFIADEIGQARRGKGGMGELQKGEVAWVSFRHYTARPAMHIQDGPGGATASVEIPVPGDPQAHIHNPVFNAVATEDGHLGSLDSARITRVTSHLFGAYFQAVLGELLRESGIRVRPDERGKAIVIEAIPRSVCEAFSKRSKQAEKQAKAFVARQGGNWNTMSADQKFKVLHQANLAYRSKKYNGTNDREIWREEAEALGWRHATVLTDEPLHALDDADRYERAYQIAARLLEEEFRTAAVLDRDVFRLHAAHGLIETGIKSVDDVRIVAEMIAERGITVDGKPTMFIEQVRDGRMRVATQAQLAVEKEMGELAGYAARNPEGALSAEAIAKAVRESGLDFTRDADHGRTQLAAIYALGQAGGLGFLVGVAGAGKTAALSPLVTAWKEDGRQVVGTALAWRQADALKDAGADRTVALSPLLREMEAGRLVLARGSVLVVDEVSQIAPGQLLRLLRFQKEMGFSMRLLGDREQAQAIEAGDSVEILLRVLPREARPEILTTIRQKTERARRIAGMFRSNGRDLTLNEQEQRDKDTARVRQAIDMKRADGTFAVIGGDHAQVVADTADFYLRRRDMLVASGSARGITMSAPTNEDVMALSVAVRERLRARGEIGTEEIVRAGIDQRGEVYDLPLAVGDRVRLFSQTRCRTGSGRQTRWRELGSNGDFVDVRGWNDQGVFLRNLKGREGFVPWASLADPDTGRTKLGFGHAMTIDAAQGITSDEHINAMPRGTMAVSGFTTYVAESRHAHIAWTRVAEAPVREAITFARPLGDKTPVTYIEAAQRDGRAPGAAARSHAATRGLREVAPARWDDISRTLRRSAYALQNQAEAAVRLERDLPSQPAPETGTARGPARAPRVQQDNDLGV